MAFTPFTESDQPTMANFNEKFQEAIQAALDEDLKIEVGTYTGTGTGGASNPNHLTLSLNCKLLLITPSEIELSGSATTGLLLANSVGGISFSLTQTHDVGGGPIRVSVSGNTVSYYGVDQYSQMNQSGVNYTYVAIGKAVTT